MEKLINKRFLLATPGEVAAAVKEIEGYMVEYGWQKKRIMPYGYGVEFGEFIKHFADYEKYTTDSKVLLLDEINGLIEHCVNPWLKVEREPKVRIRFENGKEKEVAASIAADYVEFGIAEYI